MEAVELIGSSVEGGTMSDMTSGIKDEVESATPDDDDIVADVANDPGTEDGDLNAAGSEPEGRGE
jgi:hypothetical protein